MAPPSSVPANAAAVAGRICPNPRLMAAAGIGLTSYLIPLSFLSFLKGAE